MSICGIEALRVGRVGSIREHLTVADSLLSDAVRCSQCSPPSPPKKEHTKLEHTLEPTWMRTCMRNYSATNSATSSARSASMRSCNLASWRDGEIA